MKNNIIYFLFILLSSSLVQAQDATLNSAMQAYRQQDYKKAANDFYKMTFSTKTSAKNKLAARYYLGLSLKKLKLYQAAAFPLILVTKEGSESVSQKSFEQLVIISKYLNDSTLLDFTLKKLDAANLNELAQEIYHTLMGQALMKEKNYLQAIEHLKKVLKIRADDDDALYTLGLVYLKQNDTAMAIPVFEKLYGKYYQKLQTNLKRGTMAMALARAYYQAKKWPETIETYRQIPKDHPLYREAQTELTWALFRSSKFRTAMSTIQTLHTPFYENFYDPESLILRTIIFLFVCQSDEAEKSLITFQKNYDPAYSILADINKSSRPAEYFYTQIDAAQKYLKSLKAGKPEKYEGQIPLFIVRAMMAKSPLKNRLSYLKKVNDEQARAHRYFTNSSEASLKKYVLKILKSRQKNAEKEAGRILQDMLISNEEELSFYTGDASMLRYEILNTRKEAAHKTYLNDVNKNGQNQINQKDNRNFYISNGYRYWPFEGEFWRDEIGNYQYLGVNRCEAN